MNLRENNMWLNHFVKALYLCVTLQVPSYKITAQVGKLNAN